MFICFFWNTVFVLKMNQNRYAFIGIDPSINSTGVVTRISGVVNGQRTILGTNFYILKPDTHEVTKTGKTKSPLTKAEEEAQTKNQEYLKYVLYDKILIDKKNQDPILVEHNKTTNFINIVNKILEIIDSLEADKIYICIEGISYGSAGRTMSVFDLAGLNYMIRSSILNKGYDNLYITPPTVIKKFASGKGNANKEVMIELFNAIYGYMNIPKADDIADAFFMSRYAQRICEKEENL